MRSYIYTSHFTRYNECLTTIALGTLERAIECMSKDSEHEKDEECRVGANKECKYYTVHVSFSNAARYHS